MWVELLLTAMGVLTVTLSVLLATALLIGRPGAPRADRFLAGFLLLSAVDLIGWTAALMPAAVQSLLVFRLPLGFLQMPWLLAYVWTLSEPKADCRPHLWAGGTAVLSWGTTAGPRASAPNLENCEIHPTLSSFSPIYRRTGAGRSRRRSCEYCVPHGQELS